MTWPGAVGTLTALAPGRFAAAINQAPLFRRTRSNALRRADYLCNFARTLWSERGMPPLHLLRHAFETAADFSEALALLTTAEIARPVIFTLVGCAPDEIAIIERRERDATVHRGEGAVANDWRQPVDGWEPRPSRSLRLRSTAPSAARRSQARPPRRRRPSTRWCRRCATGTPASRSR